MRIALAFVVGTAIGIAVAFFIASRHHAPRVDPQTRLLQRAVKFYAASRRLDQWTMVRMFTPALQLAAADKLRTDAEQTVKVFQRSPAADQKDMLATAAGIDAKQIKVQRQGDWALTSGNYELIASGTKIPARLEELCWLWRDGDWWVFNLAYEDLHGRAVQFNAYGCPPDFALHLDKKD